MLLTVGFSIIWAKLSRMCGGGNPKLPFGLDQHIYATPYLLLSVLINPVIAFNSCLLHFFSYFTALLGKRQGHGQYFDLGKWTKKIKAEKIDPIVRLFFGKDPNTINDNVPGNKNRDKFGLTLTGIVCGMGISVAAFLSGFIAMGIIYLVFSSTKGIIYWFSDKYNHQLNDIFLELGIPLDEKDSYTEKAEWINGFIPLLPIFASIFTLIFSLVF